MEVAFSLLESDFFVDKEKEKKSLFHEVFPWIRNNSIACLGGGYLAFFGRSTYFKILGVSIVFFGLAGVLVFFKEALESKNGKDFSEKLKNKYNLQNGAEAQLRIILKPLIALILINCL